jgi:hypothetical protein
MRPEYHPCCGVYLHVRPDSDRQTETRGIAVRSLGQAPPPDRYRWSCPACYVDRVFSSRQARDAWLRRNRREARSETK